MPHTAVQSAAAHTRASSTIGSGARYALAVLFAINLMNFFDRQIAGALAEPIRVEFGMTVVLKTDPKGAAGNAPIIEQPVAIEVQPAEYPESAHAKKIEGDVEVEARLDATGHVTATTIVQTVSPELDQAAVDAIRASTFRPGMRNGEPVPVTITMTMRFKLD